MQLFILQVTKSNVGLNSTYQPGTAIILHFRSALQRETRLRDLCVCQSWDISSFQRSERENISSARLDKVIQQQVAES